MSNFADFIGSMLLIEEVPYQFLGHVDPSWCSECVAEILRAYAGRYQAVALGHPGTYLISFWLSKN